MKEASPLLRTKLRPPFLRPQLVPRPWLQAKLMHGLRGPLTLITAPAGFGKTTLVSSCITHCGLPVAWLSLDKDDNQERRFLNYLLAALHESGGTVGSEASHLLAQAPEGSSAAVLTTLINELDVAGSDMVLVLDDYQSIRNPLVHQAVAFLVEHAPGTFHLVIASRSDPLLPLTRLRARGQMVELRAADLRFSQDETTRFLNDVMGLDLDVESVAVLASRTEGWIVGLQMAALALQGAVADHGAASMQEREAIRGFIDGFSGTHRYILDYLLEEVLARQSPEIQHFLLYTSPLERLTAPLCDFLVAATDKLAFGAAGEPSSPSLAPGHSASILARLERANLFLVPLDNERIWYRYHHLFADLLRARLQQAQPDLVSLLHVRASTWLHENGLITEAIHHLLAAGENSRAADLIERYGPACLAEGDPSVLQMANTLPQTMLLDRPRIGLYQAWYCITQGRIAEAVPLLQGMAQRFAGAAAASGQPWMQAWIASALAFLAAPSVASESAALPDYRLLEAIPATDPILRNAADLLYGMTLGRREDLDGAVAIAIKCIQRENKPRGAAAIPTLAPFLTRLYLMQGRLHATVSLCREYLDPIEKRGIRFVHTAGSMKIDLGEALYEWNSLEEAEQHIRDGLQDNEPWQNIMTAGLGLVALARVLQAKGDYAGAMQAVAKLEDRMRAHSHPREFDEALRTLRIRVQLASGDLGQASAWADQVMRRADFAQHEALYRPTLARIRLAEGSYAAVARLLSGPVPAPRIGSRLARQLETELLLAAALAGQQRLPEAFARIASALAQGEPEGYLRTFLDVGEPARDLLAAYLRSDTLAHAGYAQKIVDAFSSAAQADAPAGEPIKLLEPLTGRELEVLELIALGRTNKEIAQQLIIAPGTVKAHTASIYRKLDVANRTEAASRAREIGLLS